MKLWVLWTLSISVLFIDSSGYQLSEDPNEVTDSDRRILLEISKSVKRVKRNPFDETPKGRSSSDSDLREKEETSDDEDTDREGGGRRGEEKTETFTGSSNDYCDKFEQHFSYFCVGETDQSDRNAYVIKKFCPSYKTACRHKAVTSSVSLTSWPTDPFAKQITVTSAPTPSRSSSHRRRYSDEDSDSAEDEEVYYAELRKRYPCKPDCDRRIFAHCTEECKCDYIYPIVQRFCNPPPMPLFLNTCRLWYHGCPKYERYHYSSQFVYSKAEKGKVLPGTPQQNPINPYNLPQSSPMRVNRALALAPIRRQKRETEEDVNLELELVVPPPVPKGRRSRAPSPREESEDSEEEKPKKHISRRSESVSQLESEADREISMSAPTSRVILQNYQEEMKSREKKRRSRRKKLRRRRRHRQRFDYDKDFEPVPVSTTQRPPTPRELWRALKQINSLTSGPGAIGLKSSPATLKGGNAPQGGLDGLLASVAQAQQEKEDTERQWAAVATDPRSLTEDIVQAATSIGKKEAVEEPDFNKIKPRTIAPAATTAIVEEEQGTQPSQAEVTGDGLKKASSGRAKAHQGNIPILPSDAAFAAAGSSSDDTFRAFDGLSDSRGLVHTPRSRSPFTKPGLWEPNPADPHSRDPANKYWYHPESVGVDWLNGQLQWGGHWAVPAAGTGGTAGMSAVHFPTIGSFLNIPDDYD